MSEPANEAPTAKPKARPVWLRPLLLVGALILLPYLWILLQVYPWWVLGFALLLAGIVALKKRNTGRVTESPEWINPSAEATLLTHQQSLEQYERELAKPDSAVTALLLVPLICVVFIVVMYSLASWLGDFIVPLVAFVLLPAAAVLWRRWRNKRAAEMGVMDEFEQYQQAYQRAEARQAALRAANPASTKLVVAEYIAGFLLFLALGGWLLAGLSAMFVSNSGPVGNQMALIQFGAYGIAFIFACSFLSYQHWYAPATQRWLGVGAALALFVVYRLI